MNQLEFKALKTLINDVFVNSNLSHKFDEITLETRCEIIGKGKFKLICEFH